MSFTASVFGPQLDAIEDNIKRAVDVLIAFFKNDASLRAAQSENEPLADGMQQGSNVNGTDTMTLPSGATQLQTPFTMFVDGQDTTAKKYSYLVVIISSSSGSGRYSIQQSIFPDQAGRGHEIPAGGTVITIPGTKNIQAFRMCPDSGLTINYTMQGFK